jgi:hypothetical protein
MGKRGVAKQVPPSLVPKLSPKKVAPTLSEVTKVPLSLLHSIVEEPEADDAGEEDANKVRSIEEKFGGDPAARTTQEKRQREEAAEDSSSDASDQQECKRHRGEDADPPPEYVAETQNDAQGEAQWEREVLDKEEAEEKKEEEQGTTPASIDIQCESSAEEVTANNENTKEQQEEKEEQEAILETVVKQPSLVNVITAGAQEETKEMCVQAEIQIATRPKLAKREPSPEQVCTYHPSLNDTASATILWPVAPRGISPLHQRLALQAASAAARAVVASIAAYAMERELEHEYIG